MNELFEYKHFIDNHFTSIDGISNFSEFMVDKKTINMKNVSWSVLQL